MKKGLQGNDMSRRSFIFLLAGAGTAAAATTLPFLTGCAPSSRDALASGEQDGGQFDIIVVGAGGAGMNAALSAHEAGANVVILEKLLIPGGNTLCAEGGMNASETGLQKTLGIKDSNELFADDTFKGGHGLGNKELIDYLCKNSNAAIERLASRNMFLTKISTSGGASVQRIHRPEDGSAVGLYFVNHMTALCRERGIDILTDMDVKEIILEDGRIAGVRAFSDGKWIRYSAPAVIITTGGFGANHKKLAQYRPELLETVTTNKPGAQGDGIVMAEALGADTVDMKEIQVHPTVEQKTGILLSEGIRGDGAILINSEGNRFIDELLTRDVVSAAEWKQPGGWAYAVFDHEVFENNTSLEHKFVKNGLIISADTLEELAEKTEADAKNFVASINAYNSAIANDTEDPFKRWKSRYPIVEAPFYAVKIAPGIHHTMGGLRIDVDTRVLDKSGNPIPGLFAAGEVTGGIHGGNRLGGNAMCDINVFGHRSAESAMEYLAWQV